MKTFYALEDIETLAASGVRQLLVDEDTVLTDMARDAAGRVGLRLTPAARAGTAPRPTPANPALAGGKPRGCQHGPLPGAAPAAAQAGGPTGKLVDDLVGAVKHLADAGPAHESRGVAR